MHLQFYILPNFSASSGIKLNEEKVDKRRKRRELLRNWVTHTTGTSRHKLFRRETMLASHKRYWIIVIRKFEFLS